MVGYGLELVFDLGTEVQPAYMLRCSGDNTDLRRELMSLARLYAIWTHLFWDNNAMIRRMFCLTYPGHVDVCMESRLFELSVGRTRISRIGTTITTTVSCF